MSGLSSTFVPIGSKLEEFYLALYAPPGHALSLDRVVECMHQLEDHQPLASCHETVEVIDEILKDCRKKSAQHLRVPFAETIRNVIAVSRKRLVSKAALDSESSLQHNQRHLNTLIELLGTWSNIVVQCVDYSFSRALTRLILSPLYTRIIEASLECFKTFKRDKELDLWNCKLLDDSFECNIAALDSLVSQVSGMKELLHQHYTFLYQLFSTYDIDSRCTEIVPAGIVESMLIVSTEELLHWRELDAVYVTMEFGFINRATQEALKETELLEIEESVYIPQCIEDVFFVLSKVSYRALSTGSDSAIMGVANRVLETIRETPPNDFDKHSFLFRLVTNKNMYRRCTERKSISSSALTKILNGPKRVRAVTPNSAINSAYSSSHTTPHKSTNSIISSSNVCTPVKATLPRSTESTNGGQTVTVASSATAPSTSTTSLAQMLISATEEGGLLSTMPGSPGMGLVNSITDLTSVSLTGVNWWLSDQLSPYIGTAEPAEVGQNNTETRIATATGGIAMKDCSPDTVLSNSDASTTVALPPAVRVPPPHNAGNITPRKPSASCTGETTSFSPPSSQNGLINNRYSLNNIYGSTGSGSTAPTSHNSALSLDEMLLNALVGEEPSSENDFYNRTDFLSAIDFTNITTTYAAAGASSAVINTDYFEHCMYVDELRAKLALCENDWVVQLNTLYTVAACTNTLRGIYSQGISITDIYKTSNKKANNNPVDLIIQELSACESRYRTLLADETKVFARWVYTCYIELPWMKFCTMNFVISGEEMETRAAHSILHSTLRKCFGMTPLEKFELEQLDKQLLGNKQRVTVTVKRKDENMIDGTENAGSGAAANSIKSDEKDSEMEDSVKEGAFMRRSGSRLSQGAYVVFLAELCNVMASQLFEKLLCTAQFNEWGALLLYQEVISLSSYMEHLIDHMDPVHVRTVKATFDALNLALKILTLDAPGDIRRYNIDQAVLNEALVRAILGRRIDFSKEAIKNVKLSFC